VEITENRLIERISRFGRTTSAVLRGLGDDGAVIDLDKGAYVFVQDALVEGIHFDLAVEQLRHVGKKAVYVNVSDILAMGAEPLYFLVSLGIPKRIASAQIEDLYRGMNEAAKEFGAFLVGGDTTEAKEDFFIDLSMTGRLVVPEYLGRDKAAVGDLIAVTGCLGEAAYGLQLLKEAQRKKPNRYTRRYAAPRPPLEVWKALVRAGIPKAMMDVSDGLLIDLERMMHESKARAIVHLEMVPVPAVLRRGGQEILSIVGGEDYHFLFTFDRSMSGEIESLRKTFPELSIIGEVVSGEGVALLDKGVERKATFLGYEHFRASGGNA
jgi:thiamine-monophosphate kinase